MNQRQTIVYTEGYAAPEQRIGRAEPRSDLFSLAATLYHLATGKPPEGHWTALELEEQLNDPKSPLPAEHRWFFELLKINLAEDVNDRYFSAEEFKADLERGRVTREANCPRCGAVNEVRKPYCGRCASPMTRTTVACSKCGKNCTLGSRFCIHCGNRI